MATHSERILPAAILAALVAACDASAPYVPASFGDRALVADATPLPPASLARLAAVYGVEGSDGGFGSEVVALARDGLLSIYADDNAAYLTLVPGCLDGGTRVVLEGPWRHGMSDASGLARFFVAPEATARALCADTVPVEPPRLVGAFVERAPPDPFPEALTTFVRARALVDPEGRFRVIAHRGGCRTADDCGASENSAEVLRLASRLGANGVEIDVRVTSDGVAVLYHDEELNPRLVRGRYCLGPLADFSSAHLQAFCRLQFGEAIPTLDEALRTVVEDTSLEAVWLDVKTPESMNAAIDSVRRAQALAASRGRMVHFGVGLAEQGILDAWMAAGAPADVRCLCELEPDDARRAGCEVWAPRWTRGPLTADVAALHAEGIAVAFWTLDESAFIDVVLEDARPDAILTNRAGVVAHRFQTVGHLSDRLVP